MKFILALETATSSCSVAMRIDDEIVGRSEIGSNVHSQVLLSMVESVLLEASIDAQDIDAVAVGQGPGSFTGLRIGVGVGQGLAFGANCPMIGVSSLDALALQAQGNGAVIAGIDARMGEVYWSQYQKNESEVSRVSELQVTPPADVSVTVRSNDDDTAIRLVGNAWAAYEGEFSLLNKHNLKAQEEVVYPSAEALLVLAEEKYGENDWVAARDFVPIYIRNNVAKKSTKQLPGRRAIE